ncbi:MAG TPA: MipA/OmpV family protein [Gemmatimonadaceae bacterium]|nr:MipA/OmpV family protein [Gemmatimonadaceae bacterium]
MRRAFIAPLAIAAYASIASAQQPPPTGRWHADVGIVSTVMPAYPGSDEQTVRALPMASVEYGRFFLGPSTAGLGAATGAYLVRSSAFTWTAEVGAAMSRMDDGADALAGMDDQSVGAVLGSHVAYMTPIAKLSASVAAGRRKHEGLSGNLSVETGAPIGRWMVGAGTSAVFGDHYNVAYDFGVSSREAARRQALVAGGDTRLRPGEDRAFAPRGGLKELRTQAMIGRTLSERITGAMFAGVSRLEGDAADSPLTRRRTTVSSGVALLYRFGAPGGGMF